MDLKSFILYHREHESLSVIEDGFEKSSFVETNSDIAGLVKQMITAYASDDVSKQNAYNQLQSGGIAGTKPIKTESTKKQSFCTEFNQMITNILGLLGFEFSKYLFVLFGIKRILAREINYINNAHTYNDILTHMIYFRNIISLGEVDDPPTDVPNESPLDIADDFFEIYGGPDDIDSTPHHVTHKFDEIELKTKKVAFFDSVIMEIKAAIKRENILSFDEDKHAWVSMLQTLLEHLTVNSYTVNTIDDLVFNLGRYNVAYDKSFIKMFDIVYDETFAQVGDIAPKLKPHIKIIKNELKLDVNCAKYLLIFSKYFHKMFDETLKSALEVIQPTDILKVNIPEPLYERLADITLNMYVQLSRKIATSQMTDIYFGKSTRIQFKQVFQALLDCAPRSTVYTKTQRAAVHYCILSVKAIKESIRIVCEMN